MRGPTRLALTLGSAHQSNDRFTNPPLPAAGVGTSRVALPQRICAARLGCRCVPTRLYPASGTARGQSFRDDHVAHVCGVMEGAPETDIALIQAAMNRDGPAIERASNIQIHLALNAPPVAGLGTRLATRHKASEAQVPDEEGRKKWRRGWDSNPRAGITRPSDFESAPL